MNTILILNAASSLLAAGGIVGFLLVRARRDRRAVLVQPVSTERDSTSAH